MRKRYKALLILLVFLFITLITTGIGVTYAYYQTTVTGAITNRTSKHNEEIEIVDSTHTIIPAASVAVDEIEFYVKNYTGSDATPTAISEVYLTYVLTFTLPTWESGCTNPISYKLYSITGTNTETEVSLSSNKTGAIDFGLDTEKDHYKLKLYWNMSYNSASCYAEKSGNVGISANLYQTPSKYSA